MIQLWTLTRTYSTGTATGPNHDNDVEWQHSIRQQSHHPSTHHPSRYVCNDHDVVVASPGRRKSVASLGALSSGIVVVPGALIRLPRNPHQHPPENVQLIYVLFIYVFYLRPPDLQSNIFAQSTLAATAALLLVVGWLAPGFQRVVSDKTTEPAEPTWVGRVKLVSPWLVVRHSSVLSIAVLYWSLGTLNTVSLIPRAIALKSRWVGVCCRWYYVRLGAIYHPQHKSKHNRTPPLHW